MPTYEYRCKDCGKEFEYQQRMSDDPKTVCESCEGPLERLISRTSFHLKGGGWYKDLYSSTKKSDDKSSESSSTDDKSSGSSSDASSSSPASPDATSSSSSSSANSSSSGSD